MSGKAWLAAGLLGAGAAAAFHAAAEKTAAPEREFTLVSVQIDKAKFWLPSLLVVKRGEKVRLTLKNMIPGNEKKPDSLIHGFALDEFSVVKVVKVGEEATAEFTADKAGLFRMYCQLHAPHIGGQLLVLE